MRSHRRRLPLDHLLIAGDLGDLDAIRALVATLPERAYGQVFIDADDDTAGATLDLELHGPARLSIVRLTTAAPTDGGHHASVVTRGKLLADAVTAWATEWMPDEPTLDRIVTMWIGGRDTPAIDAACASLPHAPHRL